MSDSTERYFSGGKLNTAYMDSRADQIAKQFAELDRDALVKLLVLRMVEHEMRDELDAIRSETDSIRDKLHHHAEHEKEAHNKKMIDALYREFQHYAQDSKELYPKVKKHSEEQSKRRRNKPTSSDDHDPNRNDRIKQLHALLKSTGAHDHIKQTAEQFSLEPRTVSRIVNGK